MLFEPVFDLFGRRDDNIDIFAEREAKVLRRARIQWINQRDLQCVAAHSNRQRAVQPSQSARNQTQNFRRNFFLTKIDIFRPECVGDGLIKAGLIDITTIDHGLRDRLAVQIDFVQHVFRL